MPGPTASNPDRNAWRRLRRNKGALAGLVVIAASVMVAAAPPLEAISWHRTKRPMPTA